MTEADSATPGELVAGRYQLQRELARGGVGVVYRAIDVSTQQEVALKRLLDSAAHSARITALFEREYHTLARMKHPRIVEVFDYGIDKHGPYYTMELLDGRDLGELAPIPYREACRYLRDVASSLALLHTRNRLHRDLSPRNVRITSDNRCKLLDFGTMAGFGVAEEIVGTPPMVPPEALRGTGLDHRSDLYSLGALAYRLLTNRHAYRAKQLEDLPELWLTQPARVHQLVPDAPPALDDLVMSMLSLDPMYRPASASEVIDRLTAIGELPPDEDRVRTAESYLLNSRLIGRTHPMETLQRRIARAHTKQGSTVVIEGNPGVGKTRVLDEAALQAQLTGALTIRVEARSNRGPNAVAHALAKAILHAAPHDAREAALPYAPVLGHVFEEFAQLAPRASLPDDASVLRARLHAAFLSWLLDLSNHHTLVLLVDDLHRVDESSASLLGALAQEAKQRRILLVTTRRLAGSISAPEAVAALTADARRLRLHRLRRKDTLALMSSLFGEVPNSDDLGNWVHDITTGSPMQIMELARHLVEKSFVRFVDGMWVLPPSVPREQLPVSLAATMSARAAALSGSERALAEALCVRRGTVPLQLCLALAEEKSQSEVFRTLDELISKGVLTNAADGYRFGQDSLREVLLAELPPERGRFLHKRLGEALLRLGANRPQDVIEAGWHVLRGGDEHRGADLLAQAAPKLTGRGIAMSAALPALEAALALYEKQGRSPRDCLWLRSIMVGSMDRRIIAEYGEATVSALCYHAGVPIAERLTPVLGRSLSFYVALLLASVRRWLTPTRRRGPRPIAAVALFYRAAYAVMTVRTSTMDIAGMQRLTAMTDAVAPSGVLGRLTSATFRGSTLTLRALPTAARKWHLNALSLAKAHETLPGANRGSRRGIMGAVYIGLGMVEAQYSLSSKRVLQVIDELAELSTDASVLEPGSEEITREGGITTPELTMAAHQIRVVFHLMRAEREKADAHRNKLRATTIQTGLGMQFDIWRTLVELAVSTRTMDVAALRRCAELLTHFVGSYPMLTAYLDLARAELSYSLRKLDDAMSLLGKWVPSVEPGSVGMWDILYACYAEIAIAAGKPELAKQTVERALSSPAMQHEGMSAGRANLDIQLARAEAELGNHAVARGHIDRLMEALKDADHPVVVGFLHETGAFVAARAGDRERQGAHLDLMRQWYAITRHPSLLMRAQRVTDTLTTGPSRAEHAPNPATGEKDPVTRVTTQRQVAGIEAVFDDCRNADERAARALHIIVEQSAGTSGHLYVARNGKLRLTATLEADEPSDEVERILQEQFDKAQSTELSATPTDAKSMSELAIVALGGDANAEEDRYATMMLRTGGRDKKLVGAVALRVGTETPRGMRRGMLEAIARHVAPELEDA